MYRSLLTVLFVPYISAFMLDTFGLGSSIKTVTELDVQKYVGHWYQMYASQSVYSTFERDAVCVTADYSVTTDGSGKVKVLNFERVLKPNGTVKLIHGFATPSKEVGKLSVSLEGVPFPAPYWVIKLGPTTFGSNDQYQFSIVTDNLKATLFVLARDPVIFKRDYESEVLEFLKEQGFTSFINKPIETYQGSDCQYNPN